MGYILPCLQSDDEHNQFTNDQSIIWFAISVYLCTLVQCALLALLIFNVWNFLYK